MTVAARACLAAALAGLTGAGAAVAATPARADAFFQAQTTATAVHLSLTQKPASSIITASLVDDAAAYAASDFDSGSSSEALAAPLFPGRLVVQGPKLLCTQVFSCPTQPPDYPLLADASYPRQQKDSATAGGSPLGSGPVVATPLAATATADSAGNRGHTSSASVALLGDAVRIGTGSASSQVRSTGSTIRVHVESVVSDVTVAGILHIGSVHAVDDIVMQAGHKATNRPSITIGGVTVAGHAATIDDTGIHVAGRDGPSLQQTLRRSGVAVSTVGVHRGGGHSGARSDATALAIDLSLPVKGTPYIPNPLPPFPPPFDQIPHFGVNANGTYVGRLTLGAVGAAVAIGHEPTFHLGGVGQIPPPSPAPTAPQAGAAPTQPVGPGSASAAAPPADTTAPAVAGPAPTLAGGLRRLLERDSLDILYAVLALGTAALFLGWRGSVLLGRGMRRR